MAKLGEKGRLSFHIKYQPLTKGENTTGGSSLLTAKSFLLTVGLGCLRSIGLVFFTYGLVFFAYGGNWVWSVLLTVPPPPGIRFGLFFFLDWLKGAFARGCF